MNDTASPLDANSGLVRSYVLRQGRLSAAQARSLERGLPRWGLPYQNNPLRFDVVFGRKAPCILEIGFGMGHTTAQIARDRPDCDFIGIEVHTPGVGSLLKAIESHQLNNVRVIRYDAVAVLRDMIAPLSLDGVHIFFPDPWPKKRHHKRRLIQKPFVDLLVSRLAPGATVHCATDWEDYATHILAVLSAQPLLRNTATGYAPRPAWRGQTKFEQRGLRLGHDIWDIVFTRQAENSLTSD